MKFPPEYSNYWLDLARKEQDQNKAVVTPNKRKLLQQIANQIGNLIIAKKKKP